MQKMRSNIIKAYYRKLDTRTQSIGISVLRNDVKKMNRESKALIGILVNGKYVLFSEAEGY